MKSDSNAGYILENGLDQMGIIVPDGAIGRLVRYFAELKKWNKAINLVAKADDQHLLETHFLDSLTLLPLLEEWNSSGPLLDVGSGAGFPGLALKAAQPELQVTLLEPRGKRVSFLKHIIRTLQLEGVTIHAARLEEAGLLVFSGDEKTKPIHLQPHPVITSRAFTQIVPFLDLAAPVCPAGGRVICMQGGKTDDYQVAGTAFDLTGSSPLTLPFSNDLRTLQIFTKNG